MQKTGTQTRARTLRIGGLLCGLSLCAAAAPAQDGSAAALWSQPSLNLYGVPGLLDMPGAHQAPDADFTLTFGGLEDIGKLSAHFQFTERLSGVFRYTFVNGLFGRSRYFDRSFDLRYQIAEETRYGPAVTVGLQDFGGTGIYAGEYIVAGKTFGRLRATAGLGWGRFGSFNGITNPVDTLRRRGGVDGIAGTGQLDTSNWFRGDIALFGGLEYQATDRLRFAVEYSTDDYRLERRDLDFERDSPVNVGMDYALRDTLNLRLSYLYGTTVGAQLSYVFRPRNPNAFPRARGPGPVPVGLRQPGTAADLGWTGVPDAAQILADGIGEALEPDDIEVDRLTVAVTRAEIRIRNGNMNTAQAVGRVARVLSQALPASIETFDIVPVTEEGIAAARIRIARSDLEELVNAPDGSWQSFARARIDDGYGPEEQGTAVDVVGTAEGNHDRFTWGIGPYLEASYFDPDSPVRLDFGLRARSRWEPAPGLVFAGELRQRIVGNRSDLLDSNSVVQRVRSDAGLYAREGGTALRRLTAAQYFRPGEDLYGRVTLGYLERMYAGVSTEVLWKPVDSRLALGAEVSYARQRAFAQDFGLRDYDTVTGHVSAYYKTPGDYHYQLDLGRYLAEDWGGTLTIDREFRNGTRIGVFATLTDMPFDDFGEGAFDKGVRITIPFSVITGDRRDGAISRTIRPVLRDGGAKLQVPGRLYGSVRSWHEPAMQDQWGRFWR